MENIHKVFIGIVTSQVIIGNIIIYYYTRKVFPHIKEEYRTKAKYALIFNTGIRKKWVNEEGWVLLKKQGWIVFFYMLSTPIVWLIYFSLW